MAFATAVLAFEEEASLLFALDLGLEVEVGLGFSVAVLIGATSVTISLVVTDGFGASGTPNEFPNSWLLASLAEELGGG